MIPKVVHFVWPAHDPIPYTFQDNIASWDREGWTIEVWTEDRLDNLTMRNGDLYDAAKKMAPNDWIRWRADIARLEIVYQFGGVYADMDAECLKPLDPLLGNSCWVVESPNALGHATQAVFAAEAGHPFIGHLLDSLSESARRRGKRIHPKVGSRFVDREYQAWGGRDVEMMPWHQFAARSITDRKRGVERGSTGYVNHQYFNTDRHQGAKKQIAAFRNAAPILTASGARWFMTSGLVLGHVREGRFLPWDGDVDVGIFPEDVDKVRAAFQEAGWAFKRDFDDQMWPVYEGIKIDIHTHHQEGDVVYKIHGPRQNLRMDYPAYLFDDLRPTVFYLQETLIPSPPEDYLVTQYGEDWLTPKPNWHWKNDPPNMRRR